MCQEILHQEYTVQVTELGSNHFWPGGGPLFVMGGGQFFLVTPYASLMRNYAEGAEKNFEKNVAPHLTFKQ